MQKSLDILKEIRTRFEELSSQTKIIGNEIKLFRLLQKRESSYLFSMGLLFTAIISFFVSQSGINKIISIIMFIVAIIISVIMKTKRRNERIGILNNGISIYRKQGLSEEEIKRLIKEDLFLFQ